MKTPLPVVAPAWALLVIGALGGCMARPRTPLPASRPPAAPANPFEDSSSSFLVNGTRFPPGETAIVKVCVTPEGTIASADVVDSSGDKRFDDFAVTWARQVQLRNLPQGTQTDTVCGPVRVEIKVAPLPEGLPGRQSAVS
jgi:TonB family protein